MKMSKEDQEMLKDYEKELKEKKLLTDEEIIKLIDEKDENTYECYRFLLENFLPYAYEIACTYHHPKLTKLDFIHAANEGLECAITGGNYHDLKSLYKTMEEGIKTSIELILSYFEENE